MRRFSLILLLAAVPCLLSAQESHKAWKRNLRTQISTARADIKAGANLAEAEQAMRTLLEDSANRDNEKIWLLLFEAVRKQHDALNENLYLKQEADTAQFFLGTLHLFDVLESMDSIDAKPDADGISRPRFREKHAAYLAPYRRNLYSGGGYFLKRADYGEAYRYFDTFIDCRRQPLFTGYSFDEKQLADAAYWAAYCGYKLRRCDIIDKYSELALTEPANEVYVLQYMADACALRGDSASYRRTLLAGFEKYPDNPYFFKYLVIFYSKHDRYDSVLDVAERLLASDPENLSALTAKSAALLHIERYEECIQVSDSIIARDGTRPMPYLNAGLAIYNRILSINETRVKSRADLRKLDSLYRQALPYFERFRRLAPDAVDRWGTPLYDIYYNLNMGKEFEEMERLLQEKAIPKT